MIVPGLVAVLVPVCFGFLPRLIEGWDKASNTNALMLGGLLAGVTVSGVLLALFQSNAGGAWDNAKRGEKWSQDMAWSRSDRSWLAASFNTIGDRLKSASR